MYHKIGNAEKIANEFRALGFNDEQILKLVGNKKTYIKRLNNLSSSFSYFYAEMKKRNYADDEIYALATNYPNAIFCRFWRGIIKKEYMDFIEKYREAKPQKDSTLDLQGVTIVLKAAGISPRRLDDIYTFSYSLLWMNKNALEDNISFQRSCHISREQLKININNYPRTLELGREDCDDLLKEMRKFGLDKKDLGHLINTCAKLKRNLIPQIFIENLKWAEEKKLDLIKLGKNILKSNIFVGNTVSFLEGKYCDFVKLGLSEDNVCKIISSTPSALTMDLNMVAYKMNLLILFGMTEEEMIKVITDYSSIFTLSVDNIVAKLRVIKMYNLIWYIEEKPKNLIQSAELIERRAEFLNQYNLNAKEFAFYVFCDEKSFVEMFKIDNVNIKEQKLLPNK